MKVHVLEDHVVDRIAAGEVVERPASVLKELLENALDAGARHVVITLERGGTALVRVVDDGEGMAREDALLAIERHATSKIRTDADLDGIVTLGFRGEALPSIASVSRLRLRTRRAEDPVGTELDLEGGRLGGVRDAAMNPGTDIAARALFFNTPARRRFLRTVPTELTHCLDLVRREVMLRDGLDVRVRHDGRDVLRVDGATEGAARVAALLDDVQASDLREVAWSSDGVSVRGWAAAPTVTRSSAGQGVFLWVGGRFVRDRVLRRAVAEASRARVAGGRHPVVALAIDVGPGEVDVNVHPAKTEVRFRDPRAVSDAVAHALEVAWNAGRAVAAPVLRGAPPPEALPDLFARPARPVGTDPLPAGFDDTAPLWTPPAPPAAEPPPLAWDTPAPAGPSSDPDLSPEPAATPSPATPPPPAPRAAPAARVLAVVDEIALVAHDDGVWAVDLRREAAVDPGPSRPLLVPVVAALPRETLSAVLDAVEDLDALGVGVRAFAPGQVAITAAPASLRLGDPAAFLEAWVSAAADARTAVLAGWCTVASEAVAARAASAVAQGRARRIDGDAVRAWIDDGGG